MFRNIFSIFTFFAALSLVSCKNKPVDNDKMQLTVSIIPQKYLVSHIAGNKFDIQVMLPTGSNHETYEPSPRDMEKVSSSKLYLALGALDFELSWLDRFLSSNPSMKAINTSEGIQMLGGHNHENNDAHAGHKHGVDPHTWLSPSCVKIQAGNISRALAAIDSTHAEFYTGNLQKFTVLADSIDSLIRVKLSGTEGKSILIFHPALAYFCRDYHLEQISIEQDGKEPSATYMAEIVKVARKKGIKAIFISKEFDTRNAESIAKEIKAKVVVFDPMAENWAENMIHLADLIASN